MSCTWRYRVVVPIPIAAASRRMVMHARLVMILAGLDHARPDIDVPGHLTARGRDLLALARAGHDCVDSLQAAVAGESVGSLFSAPLSDPTLMAALCELPLGPHDRLPHPGSPAAGRIRHGPAAPPTTVLLQQQLRAGGIDSRLVLHAPATHFTILESTRPEARIFLAHVLPARES